MLFQSCFYGHISKYKCNVCWALASYLKIYGLSDFFKDTVVQDHLKIGRSWVLLYMDLSYGDAQIMFVFSMTSYLSDKKSISPAYSILMFLKNSLSKRTAQFKTVEGVLLNY